MENYLSKFKEKHSFSDEECKRYGESDIIFDIDFEMPEDALEQWDEYIKEHGYISFAKWTGVDNGYTPRRVDKSGMDDLKSDFDSLFKNLESTLSSNFGFVDDSDLDDSDFMFDEEIEKTVI